MKCPDCIDGNCFSHNRQFPQRGARLYTFVAILEQFDFGTPRRHPPIIRRAHAENHEAVWKMMWPRDAVQVELEAIPDSPGVWQCIDYIRAKYRLTVIDMSVIPTWKPEGAR